LGGGARGWGLGAEGHSASGWRFSACVDPLADGFDFGFREALAIEGHGWGDLAGGAEVEQALGALAGHENAAAVAAFLEGFEGVKVEGSHFDVAGMAAGAVALEDGEDVGEGGCRVLGS